MHINPSVQFPQYAEFAYARGLISTSFYKEMTERLAICKRYLDLGLLYIAFIEMHCTTAYMAIVGSSPNMKFNPYDVRKPCINQPGCYNFDHLNAFIKRTDVRRELGVGDKSWSIASLEVITALRLDYWRDYSSGVTYLLNKGIPMILFYGKDDFLCNYLGGMKTIESLKWEGAQKILKQPYKDWVVDGKVMGEYKNYGKLTYLEVFDAGHMATMDNPRIGVDIIDKLVNGVN